MSIYNWRPDIHQGINMLKRTLLPLLVASALGACGKSEAPQPPAPPASTTAPAAPATPAPAAPAPAAPAPAASAAAPAAAGDLAKGEEVYKKTCVLCHGAGVAGAPKIGDKADWGPRIAQGKDTLYEHALKGFTGSKGAMPPKGGNPALSDDDVKAGVDYMVSKAQ
jgi:cytochrome c5